MSHLLEESKITQPFDGNIWLLPKISFFKSISFQINSFQIDCVDSFKTYHLRLNNRIFKLISIPFSSRKLNNLGYPRGTCKNEIKRNAEWPKKWDRWPFGKAATTGCLMKEYLNTDKNGPAACGFGLGAGQWTAAGRATRPSSSPPAARSPARSAAGRPPVPSQNQRLTQRLPFWFASAFVGHLSESLGSRKMKVKRPLQLTYGLTFIFDLPYLLNFTYITWLNWPHLLDLTRSFSLELNT